MGEEGTGLVALTVFATQSVITAAEVENQIVKEQFAEVQTVVDQIAADHMAADPMAHDSPQITLPTRSKNNKLGEASSKPHKAHTYHS